MTCRMLFSALVLMCLSVCSPVRAQGTTPDFPAFDPSGMQTVSGDALHGPGAQIDRTTRRSYPLRVSRLWQGSVEPQFRSGYNAGLSWPGGITRGQNSADPDNSQHWGAYFKVSGGMVGCRNWTATLPTSQSDPTPVLSMYSYVNSENVRYGYNIDTKMVGDFTAEQGSGQESPYTGYTDLESAMVMRWHPPQVIVNGTELLSYAPSYGAPGSSPTGADANFGDYRGVVDPALRSECVVYHGFRMVSGVDVFRAIHQYSSYPDNNYLLYDYHFINSGNCDEDTDLEHTESVQDLRIGISEQHFACRVSEGFNISRDDEALEYINPWPSYTDGSGGYRQATLFYDVDGSQIAGPDWGDPYNAFDGTEQTTGTNCYARGYVGQTMVFAENVPGSGADNPAEPKGMTWYPENVLRLGRDLCEWDQGKQFRYAYTGKDDPNDIASARVGPENTPITGGGTNKEHTTVISTAPGDLALNSTYHCVYGIAIAGLNNREAKDIAYRTLRRDAEGVAPANRQTSEEIALIQSGRDSVLAAMDRMFWNIHGFDPNGNIPSKPAAQNQAYNIPDAPRPPACLWVEDGLQQIQIDWSDESDAQDFDTGVNDFAGYRLYRAEASPDSDWVMVYDGRDSEYNDEAVSAGVTYFYAVTAYDDGTQNWLIPGESIESGMFWNWCGWDYYPGMTPPVPPGGAQIYPSSESVVSGTITDSVWTAQNSPYHVVAPCTLAIYDTLQIESGVDIIFNADVPFLVRGAVYSNGTEDENVCFYGRNAQQWGGIHISGGDSSHFSHTVITGAHATGVTREDSCGGGLYVTGIHTQLVMDHCTVKDNIADYAGGGFYIYGAAVTLSNCIVAGNSAGGNGGGIRNTDSASLTMTGCTIADNSAASGAAIHCDESATATLQNCILWRNTPDDIVDVDNNVTATYSCIQSTWPGVGNHASDPLFKNAANGDYRLGPGSPCINTGDPVMQDPDGTRSDMGAITAVISVGIDAQTPHSLSLSQNAPNPFNPVTTIEFALPEAGVTNLVIYDVTGRQVRTLVSGPTEAGVHSIAWDGRDAVGRPAASGVYVYRLTTSGGNLVKRMTLIR